MFEKSFGCPTFLTFGADGNKSRDEYVYVYSSDSPNAYDAADRMVLARVHRGKLAERTAYQFFKSLSLDGTPIWSGDIEDRGAVFSFPGDCYRSGVSYDAGLKGYLWCQILPESKHPQGPRFSADRPRAAVAVWRQLRRLMLTAGSFAIAAESEL